VLKEPSGTLEYKRPWTGQCPDIIERNRPESAHDFVLLTIPVGTTKKIQPLNIFGFRLWKNFIKHFSDVIVLLDLEIKLQETSF